MADASTVKRHSNGNEKLGTKKRTRVRQGQSNQSGRGRGFYWIIFGGGRANRTLSQNPVKTRSKENQSNPIENRSKSLQTAGWKKQMRSNPIAIDEYEKPVRRTPLLWSWSRTKVIRTKKKLGKTRWNPVTMWVENEEGTGVAQDGNGVEIGRRVAVQLGAADDDGAVARQRPVRRLHRRFCSRNTFHKRHHEWKSIPVHGTPLA